MTAPTSPARPSPGRGLTASGGRLVRSTVSVSLAALGLAWTELFLTARSDHPNTWVGVAVDTLIVVAAGLLAVSLAAGRERAPRLARVGSLVGTLVFLVPFWTAGAVPLGFLAFRLHRTRRPVLAWTAAAVAALQVVMLLVSTVITFGPGLPAR